jgi:hypothetical protein
VAVFVVMGYSADASHKQQPKDVMQNFRGCMMHACCHRFRLPVLEMGRLQPTYCSVYLSFVINSDINAAAGRLYHILCKTYHDVFGDLRARIAYGWFYVRSVQPFLKHSEN